MESPLRFGTGEGCGEEGSSGEKERLGLAERGLQPSESTLKVGGLFVFGMGYYWTEAGEKIKGGKAREDSGGSSRFRMHHEQQLQSYLASTCQKVEKKIKILRLLE